SEGPGPTSHGQRPGCRPAGLLVRVAADPDFVGRLGAGRADLSDLSEPIRARAGAPIIIAEIMKRMSFSPLLWGRFEVVRCCCGLTTLACICLAQNGCVNPIGADRTTPQQAYRQVHDNAVSHAVPS